MMRKETKKYYFSVEGETEKWYLDWLQKTINSITESKYNVKLDSKIQKNPLTRVKGMTLLESTEITHVFDRESEDDVHVKQFQETLDRMSDAEQLGKDIKYKLGYSNFTFELWIIFHKTDCNGAKTHRKQYLPELNKAYDEKFEYLQEYKRENDFKRILKKLTIEDVISAVKRAEAIMKRNEKSGYRLQQYKEYSFYKENPSLSVWEIVDKILKECEIK